MMTPDGDFDPKVLTRTLLAIAIVITTATAARTQAPAPAADARVLTQRGYEFVYNLDFPEALAAFEQAAAAQPKDAVAHRAIATATWLHILFGRGVVTVDDYIGHATTGDQQLDAPPAAEATRFQSSIARALALGEDELRRNRNSAAAHYDVGTAVGLTATYSATVEGRILGGLRAARRAYNEQETVLAIDPRRKDAGLIVGTYRYIVASLPLPVRVMAYVVGFGGGRERGVQMIEEAAAYPGESQVEAKFALVLLYNRERRFDQALALIRELQARFPRNRLLWLEAGATALRAGRPSVAEAALDTGIEMLERDPRPRAFGEEALWRSKRGTARVLLGNDAGARADLDASLGLKAYAWVHGRAHAELGKLADLAGNRSRAVSEYWTAVRLGEKGNDPTAVEQARALIRAPYRRK